MRWRKRPKAYKPAWPESRPLKTELERKSAALLALRAPSEPEWRSLERDLAELSRLENRLLGGAVRLRVESDEKVTIEPPPRVQEEGELVLTETTAIQIGSETRIVVRAAEGALEALSIRSKTLRADLVARLDEAETKDESAVRDDKAVVASTESTFASGEGGGQQSGSLAAEDLNLRRVALEPLITKRRELESSLNDLQQRLAEWAEGDPAPEKRLRAVEEELAHLRRSAPQAVLPGIEGWARDQTDEKVRELERSRAQAQRRLPARARGRARRTAGVLGM